MTGPLSVEEQDRLIEENLAVVGYQVSRVLQRIPPHISRDELASAGALALVQAARSFRPDMGVPFARYASLRVYGGIIDELRAMDWTPRTGRQRMRELSEVTERLIGLLGRTPTQEELAEVLGVSVAEVREVRAQTHRHVVSLDADPSVADAVPEHGAGPEEQVLVSERLGVMRAAVEEPPERLRHVVVELFDHDTPVVELAAQLGVTQSRISQLRTQALEMLREAMNSVLDPELLAAPSQSPGVAERRRMAYYSAVALRAAAGATRLAGETLEAGKAPVGVERVG